MSEGQSIGVILCEGWNVLTIAFFGTPETNKKKRYILVEKLIRFGTKWMEKVRENRNSFSKCTQLCKGGCWWLKPASRHEDIPVAPSSPQIQPTRVHWIRQRVYFKRMVVNFQGFISCMAPLYVCVVGCHLWSLWRTGIGQGPTESRQAAQVRGTL